MERHMAQAWVCTRECVAQGGDELSIGSISEIEAVRGTEAQHTPA
jgi:hypothetical protein